MLVVFLGSSSAAPGSPLPPALEREWGIPVEAAGREGWTPARWVSELDGDPASADRLRARADALVVYLPANGAPSAADVAALHARLARPGGPPVVWMLPPAYTADSPAASAVNGWADAIVRAGVPTLGPRPPPLRPGDLNAARLHLTSSGASYLASHTPSPVRSSDTGGAMQGQKQSGCGCGCADCAPAPRRGGMLPLAVALVVAFFLFEE